MKLFRYAYYGLHGKPEYRYYFEHGEVNLFVWLDPGRQLYAFQADLRGKTSIHFRRPGAFHVGTINNEPIAGGISGPVTEAEMAELKAALLAIRSEEFPGLVRTIQQVIGGNYAGDFTVPPDELARLEALDTVRYDA